MRYIRIDIVPSTSFIKRGLINIYASAADQTVQTSWSWPKKIKNKSKTITTLIIMVFCFGKQMLIGPCNKIRSVRFSMTSCCGVGALFLPLNSISKLRCHLGIDPPPLSRMASFSGCHMSGPFFLPVVAKFGIGLSRSSQIWPCFFQV